MRSVSYVTVGRSGILVFRLGPVFVSGVILLLVAFRTVSSVLQQSHLAMLFDVF